MRIFDLTGKMGIVAQEGKTTMAIRKAHSNQTFVCAVALAAATALGGTRPERVMSGYTGYFLGGKSDHVERMIDALAENGFNSIDVKVHSNYRKKMYVDGHWQEVKTLVDRAHSKGLLFNVYLYPLSGKRVPEWPEHASLPVPVDAMGSRIEASFLLTDPATWKTFYSEAIRYAALRKQIGFDTLRFDVEILSLHTSYDDANWAKFCAANDGFDAATPAAGRAAALDAKKAKEKYAAFFVARVKDAAAEFVKAVRAFDPEIELGYMPARDGGIETVLNEILATDAAPAWLDGWDLYNGGGYRPSVKARAEAFRRINPNNKFVAWICPNRYKPEDVAASVYHAAANTDGYSIWVLSMLDDVRKSALPKGTIPADYWAQFKQANEALRADMRDGTLATASRIPYKKVTPMVAKLSWDGVTAPALAPAGDGTGAERTAVMRMSQNVFVYARAGDPIRITITHLAGERRPGGLQYVLLGPDGKVLRNEAVTAGSKDSFSVTAEETGVHVFRATGGDVGGDPWWSVSVASPLHWAIDARGPKGAYMFRMQSFFVDGSDRGNPRIHVKTAGQESYVLTINGVPHDTIRSPNAEFDLPPGLVEVSISKSEAGYGENFWISFPNGKSPFVYPAKERRLTTKGESK